jgi:hypothetical protein
MAKTEVQPSTVGPSAFAATKTVGASGVGEATSLSHSDIAGESALSDAHAADRKGAGRGALWGVALAAVAATCAGIVVAQRPWRHPEPRAKPPASAATMPTDPSIGPSVVPAPPPATPPIVPAPPPPVVAEPPGVPLPLAASTARPPATKKVSRPAVVAKRKDATHRRAAPKTDQHGIGIPDD